MVQIAAAKAAALQIGRLRPANGVNDKCDAVGWKYSPYCSIGLTPPPRYPAQVAVPTLLSRHPAQLKKKKRDARVSLKGL